MYVAALIFLGSLTCLLANLHCCSQGPDSTRLAVRSALAAGVVYMLDCENGFGGGNVAASIGPDGILLVDDMFRSTTPLVLEALKKKSTAPVRIVVNTHFHADHIEGNTVLSRSSVIIAQENLLKRFTTKPGWATPEAFPQIVFRDSLTIRFNGEEIRLFHLPNGHTDNDVFVYFPRSGVIHMGDTYFKGMFPAVYKEGGGDILQMISNLEKVLADLPEGTKVIPGHGDLATVADLRDYVAMLKETTAIAGAAIRSGKPLKQLQQEKALAKYEKLGQGGAQTTDEYLAMLYKLLSP
jgi:cyclase